MRGSANSSEYLPKRDHRARNASTPRATRRWLAEGPQPKCTCSSSSRAPSARRLWRRHPRPRTLHRPEVSPRRPRAHLTWSPQRPEATPSAAATGATGLSTTHCRCAERRRRGRPSGGSTAQLASITSATAFSSCSASSLPAVASAAASSGAAVGRGAATRTRGEHRTHLRGERRTHLPAASTTTITASASGVARRGSTPSTSTAVGFGAIDARTRESTLDPIATAAHPAAHQQPHRAAHPMTTTASRRESRACEREWKWKWRGI